MQTIYSDQFYRGKWVTTQCISRPHQMLNIYLFQKLRKYNKSLIKNPIIREVGKHLGSFSRYSIIRKITVLWMYRLAREIFLKLFPKLVLLENIIWWISKHFLFCGLCEFSRQDDARWRFSNNIGGMGGVLLKYEWNFPVNTCSSMVSAMIHVAYRKRYIGIWNRNVYLFSI